MVEFALAGVGTVLLLISTIQLAIGMWHYHSMAYAVHEATRYVSTHGAGCSKIGYSCRVSVGTIATKIKSYSRGVSGSSVYSAL